MRARLRIKYTAHKMDVFFDKAYGKLYEGIENGECVEYRFSSDNGEIKNIFIKREVPYDIGGHRYDIITPYGYGGPVVITANDRQKLFSEYADAWEAYCRENGIVSEFVRFHLFDNCDVRESFYGEAAPVSDNVVVKTDCEIDELWMRFEHKVRKNVKKARANGLTMLRDSTGEHIDDFLRIYIDTMQRNNAESYYYFEKSYFEAIQKTLPGKFMYFFAEKDGVIVSAELVLCSEKYVYSFLGGTDSDYYDLRPNDLLKFDIISWCCETGRKAFVLGGGYHREDGIYKYKKSFAPDGDVPFYIGKKIHDEEAYARLVECRKNEGSFDEATGFFPAYRAH